MQRKVWIIDDDMVSQFATRYCIEQYGEPVHIETFANAEEGLLAFTELKLQKNPFPEIIFLDLIMDDMNGWQFIENLQKLIKKSQMPEIYILSAFSQSNDRATAKKHNIVSGYFDKPLTRIGLDRVFMVSGKLKD